MGDGVIAEKGEGRGQSGTWKDICNPRFREVYFYSRVS